jgi:hypothetical protein
MSWEVIPIEGAVHVVPVGDTKEHILEPRCSCNTRSEITTNGGLIIIHDAFDGRLGVEWAAEILK